MSLESGTAYTAETKGISGEYSNIIHLQVGPSCSRETGCLGTQACWELYTSVVPVALLGVASLTSGSVPSWCRLQCSLLTGHLSSDEMMSVLGGARRKARPLQWQGIPMHRPMYPAVLERQGKQQAFSVLLCQSPGAADSDAFLRVNY